jgi:hypothetical protein
MLECNAINVNGLDLISDKYYFTLDGLFANDNDVILNDLYTDGQNYDHTKIQVKKLVLNGFVRTRSVQDFMYLRQVLCTKGLKTFTVTIPYFQTLTFQAEISSWGIGAGGGFTIACQLVVPDPYLYDTDILSLSLGAISNTSLTFPITFPIIFGAVTGASGVVTNLGNTIAYPIITIVGTCDTVNIINTTTNQSLGCNQAISAGSTLIIDCRPASRGIYYNGVNRMDLKNTNDAWLTCAPGNNNFVFTRNSLETKLHCSISLQGRWI